MLIIAIVTVTESAGRIFLQSLWFCCIFWGAPKASSHGTMGWLKPGSQLEETFYIASCRWGNCPRLAIKRGMGKPTIGGVKILGIFFAFLQHRQTPNTVFFQPSWWFKGILDITIRNIGCKVWKSQLPWSSQSLKATRRSNSGLLHTYCPCAKHQLLLAVSNSPRSNSAPSWCCVFNSWQLCLENNPSMPAHY